MVDIGPNNKKYTITINKRQFIREIRIIEEKLSIIKIRIEHYTVKKTSWYEKIRSTILRYICVNMCSQQNIIESSHNTYALNRRDTNLRDLKKEFDDLFVKYMSLYEDVIDKDLSNEPVDLESRNRLKANIFELECLLYTISNKKEAT
jgi:hypothetical protein